MVVPRVNSSGSELDMKLSPMKEVMSSNLVFPFGVGPVIRSMVYLVYHPQNVGKYLEGFLRFLPSEKNEEGLWRLKL
jgi:hypothetical protein